MRLDGQGWVVGLALTCLKFFEVVGASILVTGLGSISEPQISGYGCQVRYTTSDGQGVESIFREADVRPSQY